MSEKLQDVAGLSQLLEDFLRDPKAYTKADMHGIGDPGGAIMLQVQGAAAGVMKKMGGKETERVGVLLYNIYTSSWVKTKEIRFSEANDFQQWGMLSAEADLKEGHKEWQEGLLEVLYCDWMTPEGVVESAEQVFCKYQPMLTQAARKAKAAAEEEEEEGYNIPAYLEALQARVSLDTREKKGSKSQQKEAAKAARAGSTAQSSGRGRRQDRRDCSDRPRSEQPRAEQPRGCQTLVAFDSLS